MIRTSHNAIGKSSRIDSYPLKSGQPDLELVKTVSSSDDEEDEDQHEEKMTNIDAEAFLDSYEEMLRHQKDEMDITLYHLQPLLELLENKSSGGKSSPVTATPFTREFTYASLKQALVQLKEDDSLRIASHDRQWKFVLQLLTESDDEGTPTNNTESISWAEIVMCYRMCVLAMQTLNQTPEPNALRTRVRQRSLQMLSSFRPKRMEGNHVASTPRHGKKPTLEWVESILIMGSLLLFAFVVFGFGHKTQDVHSVNVSNPIARFYQTPLIPGPHVEPFAADNVESPLLIPGPTVAPFYTNEQITKGGLRTSEMQVTSSPSSIIPAGELSIESEPVANEATKAATSFVKGPLDSWSATSQDDTPKNPASSVQRRDGTEGVVMTAFGVATVAGGIAATSILAPMTTSVLSTLGSTVPGLLSIGATVLVSTLLAHGIRDFMDSIFEKVRKAWRR